MTTQSDTPPAAPASDIPRVIAARLSLGAAAVAVVLCLAWVAERQAHPERTPWSNLSVGLELLTLAVTVLALQHPRIRAHSRLVGVLAIAALMVQVTAYEIVVGGEADVLNMVLLYMVAGTMVLIPWSWQGQLPVAMTALGTYAAALAGGVHTPTPISLNLLGLAAIGTLSVGAATFLDRQRRAAWEQAAALRSANEALATASRTKNQFIATVSHELRTPVSVILGYADLLVDGEFGEVPAEARTILARIARNGRNLVYLISDLVDLARIEAGRLTVRRERVDLAPVFAEMSDFVRARLEGRPVRYTVELADDLRVTADRDRLEQVLVNLLSNAAKFTERGTITLAAHASDAHSVCIEVRDTGPGIEFEERATIFEPFGQGGAGKNRGGVGMGLYLSATLARAMGGTLSVDSEVGRGSTFALTLPGAAETDAAVP